MTIEKPEQNLPATQQKAPVSLSRPLTDIDQAWRLANALSQSSLLPDALRNKTADVLTIVLYGQDLGFSPMQAIQAIYVVKGKPFLSGQTWIALARQRGHHNAFVACKHCTAPPEQHDETDGHRYEADHDATRCSFTVIRGDTGARHTETFTVEDAKTAKLLSNDNYTKYPKRMMLWRAATDTMRVICPEIAMGFSVEGEFPAPEIEEPETALALAVDARTEPATEPDEVHDADVVDDEELRQEVLNIAAEHGQGDAAWPPVAQPGGGA
jgi:hypothetical protein